MKQLIKILSFLMLMLLLTSEDCSDRGRETSVEERQMEIFKEIENNFEKEALEPKELRAFENRSLQMLEELADYLNIYADTSLLKEFRLQSKQMIYDLFTSQNELSSFLTHFQVKEDDENNILCSGSNKSLQFHLASASISENLTQQTDLTYSGSIEFVLAVSDSDLSSNKNKLEILLEKNQKQLGKETQEVWGVLLGYTE